MRRRSSNYSEAISRREQNLERGRGCLGTAILVLGAIVVAGRGSVPTVHVREEQAKLSAQLDEQVASGELSGQALYEEIFINSHVARDGGSGILGWMTPDDVRQIYPAGAWPCLADTEYNPAAGAEVSADGNTVTVVSTDGEDVITIIMDNALFGEYRPADEQTAFELSRCEGPPPQSAFTPATGVTGG